MVRPKLSKLDLQILEALWTHGKASVREIQETFPEPRPAYTTIQTIVYRLENKKAVRRVRKIGNAHIFEPILSRDATRHQLLDQILSFFGGRAQPMMAQLAEAGKLTRDDLHELETIIEKLDEQRKAEGEAETKMIGQLTNHLWQSTLFAVAAALMALALRKNRASVRYWVWLSASLKFLLPFALLIGIGGHLAWAPAAKTNATQTVSYAMVEITQPFPDTVSFAHSAPRIDWFPIIVFCVWLCGFMAIAAMRSISWLGVRAMVRSSNRLGIPSAVEVRSSASLLEPGVVGSLHPVLLLPEGIAERLTPPQLEAVFAHELCHVRRRDNLTAALHMVVEAVFWFHPLVWWIGARLMEERERACDEEVLSLGNEPRVYAESLLNVCKFYVESPVTCVSGVTGSDLKKRVGRIMRNHVGETLSTRRRFLMVAAGVAALSIPLVAGMLIAPPPSTQLPAASERVVGAGPLHFRYFFQDHKSQTAATSQPKFDAASIKLNKSGNQGTFLNGRPGGLYRVTNITARVLIASAYLKGFPPESTFVIGGPSWIDKERFDIEARADGDPGNAGMKLMAQSLIEDRFKLVMHHETQQLPIYALLVSKPGKLGPQLIPHSDGAKCTEAAPGKGLAQPRPDEAMPAYCGGFFMNPQPGDLRETGNKVTMEELSSYLLQSMDRKVVDRTGLEGVFDFNLEFAPEKGPGAQPAGAGSASDQSGAPSIFTALQEQLGLKLESTKGPVDVLVIDHIEEPSPN